MSGTCNGGAAIPKYTARAEAHNRASTDARRYKLSSEQSEFLVRVHKLACDIQRHDELCYAQSVKPFSELAKRVIELGYYNETERDTLKTVRRWYIVNKNCLHTTEYNDEFDI